MDKIYKYLSIFIQFLVKKGVGRIWIGGNMSALRDTAQLVEDAVSGNGKGNGEIPKGLERDIIALTKYLTCRHDVLTEEEERRLFGLYKDAKDNGLEELANRYKAEILGRYQRFVFSKASKYEYIINYTSLIDLLDLAQEGNIGLLKAFDRFDHTRGPRFYSYAGPWVEQQISRALLEQDKIVRIPASRRDDFRRLPKIIDTYMKEHGEEPSLKYIAEEAGISIDIARSLLRWMSNPASLDEHQENDEDNLGEFIEDANTKSPINYVEERELKTIVAEVFKNLTELETEVLKRRFGLYNNPIMSFKKIGEVFGFSKEKARKIEIQAFRKLRHLRNLRLLREYL